MASSIINFKRILWLVIGLLSLNLQAYSQTFAEYKIAAEQEDSFAQYNLGFAYYSGEGVSQDYDQAVYWFQKAAEQGHSDAKRILKEKFGIKIK